MATKKKAPKKPFNLFVWLRSSLRAASRRYPPIYEALAAAKRPYTGSNPRQKVCYECAYCGSLEPAKGVAIDHRIDCGKLTSWSDVQGFMQRLFCEKGGLDVLCHKCHDIKTYMTKNDVTWDEAVLMKDVLEILKQPITKVVDFAQGYGYSSSQLSNPAKRRDAVTKILRSVK